MGALVPLYGFLDGDTLGVLVLVHDDDRVAAVADTLQRAAAMRVEPRPRLRVVFRGEALADDLTVAQAGLSALDCVRVVPAESVP